MVGSDVGTMTAHAWAQSDPDDVVRLVLSEAFLPGYGLEEHMNPATGGSWHFGFHARSGLAAMLTAGKEEQYLSGFWSMMTGGGITAADRADLLRAYTRPDAMRGGFEHYATLVQDGRAARVGGRLAMPVLVLNGEHGLPQIVLLEGARAAAAEAGSPVFYGDTAKRWSWVHVDDLADAYVRILDNPSAVDGETFVIADDQRPAALDMQHTAVRAAGHTGEIALASAEAGGMLQMAADQDELVTSAKAHRLLGWTPRHTSFTDDPTRHYRAWKAARPAA